VVAAGSRAEVADAVGVVDPGLSLEGSGPLTNEGVAFSGPMGLQWATPRLASIGAAVLPLAVVFWAILVPPVRPAALAFILAGFLYQRWRGSAAVWPWAATVPLATIITWSLLPAPRALPGAASCTDLLSPPMLWRVAELAVVVVIVTLLARVLGAGRDHLPLGRGDGWFVALAASAGFAIAPAALLLGEQAARPFFGTVHLQIALVGAVAPALLFGVANGTLEELVYRGVLLRWTERSLGTLGAILVQAAAFGLAHTGSDFISSPIPVLATMFVMGVLAGLIVKRTGSLLVPIIVHVAFDVPLYYSLACRLS
jgi:membrane protease YdiL (CAAX protease family)